MKKSSPTQAVVAPNGMRLSAAARLLGECRRTIHHEEVFTDTGGGRCERYAADRRCAARWQVSTDNHHEEVFTDTGGGRCERYAADRRCAARWRVSTDNP